MPSLARLGHQTYDPDPFATLAAALYGNHH